MLLFQQKTAEKYKYKPIPISLFEGNIREKYEQALPEWCLDEFNRKYPLYSADGVMVCTGYERVVIGDYGAFVEISPEQICKESLICQRGQEYRIHDKKFADRVKYIWLTTKDSSGCKIYFQKKAVSYADYIPGMYYISPYEVFLTKDAEY